MSLSHARWPVVAGGGVSLALFCTNGSAAHARATSGHVCTSWNQGGAPHQVGAGGRASRASGWSISSAVIFWPIRMRGGV